MSGIVGIKTGSGKVNERILHKMANEISHRGPDDEGFFINKRKSVGLGAKRLSVIDVEQGHQPMSNEDDTVWIVFNGEIYNYLELRRDLIESGHKMKTNSDTEVIIHLYEEYGEDCLEKLSGMFAFAIWDENNRRLFAARDRLGIKPFYYYADWKRFIFASEIKALLKTNAVVPEPNYKAINEYITFQFSLGEKTFFSNVNKLLPGHYLTLSLGDSQDHSLKIHKYWDLDYNIDTHHAEDYFADKLLMLIEDSVKLCLRSDVPLGAHLSGGIDTSIIVSIASSLSNSVLRTFSGGFKEGGEYDETEYAKIVSERANTSYFEIFPTPDDFIKVMPELIYYLDEPMAGPGLFPQYFVSKLASENVKVVLGGGGGDEVFGGYMRYLVAYLEQCIKGTIFETQEEGKYVTTFESIRPNLPQLKKYKPMLQQFWRKELFESMDKRYYRLINRADNIDNLYSKDFLAMRDSSLIYEVFEEIFNRPETASYLNKMTYFDIKTLLPALLHVEDRVSMAVSLESRAPLLDHRIVELSTSIPPTIKFKNGEAKYILKKAVQNIIPGEILARKDKMGFPVPLFEWYKGPLRDFIHEILLSRRTKNRGIYNMDGVKELIDIESKFGRQIWGLLCLELWFREFID